MRTQKEIFEDFKKLGCVVKCIKEKIFIETTHNSKYWLDIEINKEMKFMYVISAGVDFVFIPLINELLSYLKGKNNE